jgi:RHS repeat-associated protein
VSGSLINTTFTYDANGNQTGGNGLSLTYASFNKPSSITRGTTTIGFAHDPEHQRFKQIAPGKEVLYLTAGGVLVEKITGTSGSVTWNNYLFVAGKMVGMRVERSSGEVDTRYFHRDHLGSVAILTDETGNVVERLSYDAWGKRRHPNGQDDPAGALASQTTRGFTGHEQLDDVGLIHMNGRVYDPLLGRFGTPDPMTENPFSTQGWNRYSYVGNSPLNFSDPSGYCFMGCFWQKPFKALGKLFNKIPILGDILKIAAAIACTPAGLAAVCATAASAFVAGVRSGSLGQALRAGLIAAASAAAFHFVGDVTLGSDHSISGFLEPDHLANIAGHAAVGCAMAMASGGKCGPGALAAGVGSLATPLVGKAFPNPKNDMGDLIGGTAATGVVSGVASVAGGGKFANGAITGAFGYLFNNLCAAGGCPFTAQSRWAEVQEGIAERFKRLINPFRILVGDVPDGSLVVGIGGSAVVQIGGEASAALFWNPGTGDIGFYFSSGPAVGFDAGVGFFGGVYAGSPDAMYGPAFGIDGSVPMGSASLAINTSGELYGVTAGPALTGIPFGGHASYTNTYGVYTDGLRNVRKYPW